MKKTSFSQLMAYVRCPEHWLFQYKLGLRRNPRKVFKHGFAMHETLAYHFEQKKQNKKGIKLIEAKEFFVHTFASGLEEYKQELHDARPFLTREYLSKEKSIRVEDMLESGLRGLEAFYKYLSSAIDPDLVEEPFSISVRPGLTLGGRLDFTDKKGIIHELKTTRKSPNKQDIRVDPQLAIYQLGYHSIKGRYPLAISKDYIVLSKKDSKVVRFKVSRPFVDKKTILRNVGAIADATKAGIFYCMHPAESWICSKEWCGYYGLHQELKKMGLQKFILKYSKK
jgi:hypothetical protein